MQMWNVQNATNHLLLTETQHMKRKHSEVQATNISRNSNESIQDENYNPDIINNAVFVYDGWCFAVFIWLFVIDKYYWNIL